MFALRTRIHNEHQAVTSHKPRSFIQPRGDIFLSLGSAEQRPPKCLYPGLYGLQNVALLYWWIQRLIIGSTAVPPLRGCKLAVHVWPDSSSALDPDSSACLWKSRLASFAWIRSYIWFRQTAVSDSGTHRKLYSYILNGTFWGPLSLTWNERIKSLGLTHTPVIMGGLKVAKVCT